MKATLTLTVEDNGLRYSRDVDIGIGYSDIAIAESFFANQASPMLPHLVIDVFADLRKGREQQDAEAAALLVEEKAKLGETISLSLGSQAREMRLNEPRSTDKHERTDAHLHKPGLPARR